MTRDAARWGRFVRCVEFLPSSHQENLGIIIAKGLSAGRPVLLPNKVDIWREVEASECGLVEPDNIARVTRLLQSRPALTSADRISMGIATREACLDHFQIGAAVRSIDSALGEARM